MPCDLLPLTEGRIILRRLEVADLENFQAYRTDPLVALYQGWESTSDSVAREFLQQMASAGLLRPGFWCQVGIADALSDRLIGDIGLKVEADESAAEIGFSLNRSSQGQGLATGAVKRTLRMVFEHSEVARIVAITDERNQSSIRLLERVGMQQFESAQAVFRGEPCVEYYFQVFR